MPLFPQDHVNYLKKLKNDGFEPKVIYDIGACVTHWSKEAKKIWDKSEFVLFDAMDDFKFLYEEFGSKHFLGVLSSVDNSNVYFYENKENPGGNSVYKENTQFSPNADVLFSEDAKVKKITYTLDTVVKQNNFPLPDLIKLDVQGSELDILKGAKETLKNCNHIIIEIQHVDYNIGAPKKDAVFEYLKSIGFENVSGMFSSPMPGGYIDGDYHFVRI